MPSRGFLAVIATVAWANVAWANTVAGRDLQSADIYSADHPTVQATARFGQLVEERSGGRHRLVVLGEENKSSEAFIVGQLRNGILDMAWRRSPT
jgi:TRAP-type C4-dicarboxylate transport system substrate-binding protein